MRPLDNNYRVRGLRIAVVILVLILMFGGSASAIDISGKNQNPHDNTKPTISITSPTNGQKFTISSILVKGTASDNVALSKVEVKVGTGGSWQLANGTISWNRSVTLASGSNKIYARATDTSGNLRETSVTVIYTPDLTLPVISITYPTNGQKFTISSILVKGTASDNVALSKVEVKVGTGGIWQLANGTTSWNRSVTLASGSNKIYARATDTSGNLRETSVTVIYTPDLTLPVISITYPTNGQKFTISSILVKGTASDNVALSKVEVKVGSGGIWQLANGTTSWNRSVTLASGSNIIYARANDTSGNSRQTSVTVTYNIPDLTLPNIFITYPINGQTFTTSTIKVNGTASDNVALVKVEVKVGTGSWKNASGTTSWNRSVTLASGNNTIYARARDTSGNLRQTSVNVTYTPYQYIHTLNNSNGEDDPYSAGIALKDTVTSSTGIFDGYKMRFEWKYMDLGNPPEQISFSYLMFGNKYIDSFTPTKAGKWKIEALEYMTNNSCDYEEHDSDDEGGHNSGDDGEHNLDDDGKSSGEGLKSSVGKSSGDNKDDNSDNDEDDNSDNDEDDNSDDDNETKSNCRRSEHPFDVIQMPEFGSLGFAAPLFLVGLLYISLRKRML